MIMTINFFPQLNSEFELLREFLVQISGVLIGAILAFRYNMRIEKLKSTEQGRCK